MTEPGVPDISDSSASSDSSQDRADAADRPRQLGRPARSAPGDRASSDVRSKLPRADIGADGPVAPVAPAIPLVPILPAGPAGPATSGAPPKTASVVDDSLGRVSASGLAVATATQAGFDLVAQTLQKQLAVASGADPSEAPLIFETNRATAAPDISGGDRYDDPLAVLTELVGSDTSTSGATPASTKTAPKTKGRSKTEPNARQGTTPRQRSSTWWRFGYPIVIVMITLAIPFLAWAGKKTVFQSTDGRILTEITDPAAPGWQALTTLTPTLLLVQTDADGQPNGLTVMSLTGDGVGGLVFVPMTTVLDLAGIGKLPLNAVAAKTGMGGLQLAVEGVLGVGMSEMRVVSPQNWADLVAPVGPLTFVNPDDVTVADADGAKKVVFATGTLTLDPKDVASYLSLTSPGENDLNRLVRQKAFWDAWLSKVGTSLDPNVVPGEKDSGLGRFVRTLGNDQVETSPLPVQSAAIPGSSAIVYLPVKDQVSSLVARLVPFPLGAPPGARPRVRLLDGTGQLDHGLKAAPLIVEGGGQIDQIGNATNLQTAKTQFVYYEDGQLPLIEKLQQALGLGAIVKSTSAGSVVDVTVTLGADFLAQAPRGLTPVTATQTGTATTTIVGVKGD